MLSGPVLNLTLSDFVKIRYYQLKQNITHIPAQQACAQTRKKLLLLSNRRTGAGGQINPGYA